MNFKEQSIFGKHVQNIASDVAIIFVSDLYLKDHTGGAELTSQALIDACPLEIAQVYSKDITIEFLQEHYQKYWIFGNWSQLNTELIPSIVANCKYSVIEYDYKYCKYRSPEKHVSIENENCNCHEALSGKMTSAFYHGARSLWWMSERQMNHYHNLYPFLAEKKNTVLSSVFDDAFFLSIKLLREKYKNSLREKWPVMGSPSWIKGTQESIKHCEEKGYDYDVVWSLSYDQFLEKIAQSKGLVFHPQGSDTCPRLVIEAKLLGCELDLNNNVQHKDEIWFDTNDLDDTEAYLFMTRSRFWNGIKADMNYLPTISGYTTTRNCIAQNYPYEESITSMLGFCDEVIVLDNGSSDGTFERLKAIAKNNDKIKLHQSNHNWESKRFAVLDGQTKAEARAYCSGDFCWQQDSDEVIHENDYERIKELINNMPVGVDLVCLPIIEYWGGPDKARLDIFPWKWRLSRNKSYITHGIPAELRQTDEDGNLYSLPGSDGCDYIRNDTHHRIPHASFYTNDIEQVRQAAVLNKTAAAQYEQWFWMMTQNIPSIHHYSWFDIGRKIRTYKNYWSKHWQSLYNIVQEDLPENNMFFQQRWEDITDDDIDKLAEKLSLSLGGWIFHTPVNFNKPTNWMTPKISHPMIIKNWIEQK